MRAAPELIHEDIGCIAQVIKRREVCCRGLGDRCAEAVRVSDYPARCKSAMRRAPYSQAIRISEAVLNRRIHGRHVIGKSTLAPFALDRTHKRLSVTSRATKVCKHHCISIGGQQMQVK